MQREPGTSGPLPLFLPIPNPQNAALSTDPDAVPNAMCSFGNQLLAGGLPAVKNYGLVTLRRALGTWNRPLT